MRGPEREVLRRFRRAGRTGAAVAGSAAAAVVVLAACANDDMRGASIPTLPPIVTTSTTTTTAPPVTTLPAYYEIQRGDTLVKIAAAYGIPAEAIMRLNNIVDPNSIQAGQIIALPPRDIVATELPPTVPGQTAPTIPGETTTVP